MTHLSKSMVDILRWRSDNQPRQMAFRFLADGEYEEEIVTYEDLDTRARSISSLLQLSARVGDRALLLFPPGLDFIASYFGCLYAGVLAIPAYPAHPARLERTLPNILRIISDAKPTVVLLPSQLFEAIVSQKSLSKKFDNIKLLILKDIKFAEGAELWKRPAIENDDIAFLQYTSGSTSTPRGVMVSHSNLMHNMGLIGKCYDLNAKDHIVSWLPPYHDMGLIGGLLQPIFSGISATIIPHLMFLQRPFRWLDTISRFNATISGGPNFAFELCIRKIKPEQREMLDLSSWEVAFIGSEPVSAKTMENFANYFAPCGFRRESLLPCYGLAESTLMVVGVPRSKTPLMENGVNTENQSMQAHILTAKKNVSHTLVSSGPNLSNQKIRIVDPETLTPSPPGDIGEIWLSGPSVAQGYWENPAETDFTFGARLSQSNEGPFLRTGDLGFLHEGELFITGRLKNLIISEGKNYYPHDIESTVEACHPAIRNTGSAVFSVSHDGGEEIIIVAEIDHKKEVDIGEVMKAIREAVSKDHGLYVQDVVLTKPGGIPKTTSGKIKHFLCREYFLEGTFKEFTII